MLDRAEYAMPSMQDVRRLIRNHGWALLVVRSSAELQAARSLPARCCAQRGRRCRAAGHRRAYGTGGSGRLGAALRATVLLVFQGPNGSISPAWYGESPSLPTWNFTAVHVRGIPEVLQGGEAFSVLERAVEHFEAARDDPWELRGDALAYARRLAHETAPFRVRSAAIQGRGEAEPGQAAQDPGPRDRSAGGGRAVPERAARRRNATRPCESAGTVAPTEDLVRRAARAGSPRRLTDRAAARSRDHRAAVRVRKEGHEHQAGRAHHRL
jgi:transcriptional regulator